MRHVRLAVGVLLLFGPAAAAQQPVLKPPESLTIKGIPPVPESILTSISAYSEFRQAASLSWVGSSRAMLVSTRFGTTNQIHRIDQPGGARRQLTFAADGITLTANPAEAIAAARPDGRSFVYVRDVARGRERYQLFLYDFATAATRLLTDGQSRHGTPVWSRDGRWLAFTSNRRSGSDRDIYVMDPDDAESSRMVSQVSGDWEVLDWSPDGAALLVRHNVSSLESHIWIVDVKTGERRELAFSIGPSQTALALYGADAQTIFAVNDAASEYLRPVRLDLRTGAVTLLGGVVRGDAEALSVSSDGRLVAYAVNEEGMGTLHVYDVAAKRERPLPALPAGSVLSARWRPGSTELMFDVNASRHPRDLFSIDVATGRISRWTAGELNGLNGDELADARLIRWPSFDQKTISGILYQPPARFTGRRPVIINIHGGPAYQERPRFLGFSNYFLNEMGVVLIYPNVRGSTGFGKSYLKADDGMRREDTVKDLAALLDWIAVQPELDPSRVMVTGASFGGYLTYVMATRYPDRIRCAFAGSAISNLLTDLEHTAPERKADRRAEYGDERDPAVRDFLTGIAPLSHASALKKPLFIAHGQNDLRVPVAESERMAAAVEQNGAPLWYLIAKDEGHGFARKPNADFLFSAWVLFVQEYLLDGVQTSSAASSR